MKKLLLILSAFVCCLSLFTQDALLLYRQNYAKPLLIALKDITNITYKDAEQVMTLEQWNISSESEITVIDSLVFVDLDTLNTEQYAHFVCPDDRHPHMIDLGMPSGILWSCCNVGASTPEGYGGYYAWGETEEKDRYDNATYQYFDKVTNRIKYIGDDIAGTEYDVAHEERGDSWRMPNIDHFKELIDNCTYVSTQQNGVNGTLVTGPNGATIFLPAAGFIIGDSIFGEGESGYYWSSSHYPGEGERYSYYSAFSLSSRNTLFGLRGYGHSVRPVITLEESKDECPVAEAIDLGLPSGTLWASWNIGASAPEDYGGHYAWGETKEKDYYSWSNYIHCEGSKETCHHIGDDIAGSEYDVAHEKWGGSWRMPTRVQIEELTRQCTSVWTQKNGVNGLLVTGPNGNTIFLPASGSNEKDSNYLENHFGYYWSSTLNPTSESEVGGLEIGSIDFYFTNFIDYRYAGFSVRAVMKPEKPQEEQHVANAIDLGLPSGTKWASWNVGASAPEEYGGYYAWGETEEKDYYDWSTYKYCMGSENTITKYNKYSDLGYNGFTDDLTELLPEDDAATVNWGAPWHTPTMAQQYELIKYCTIEQTQLNGVNGILVTGPNGNTIFMPAAGYHMYNDFISGGNQGLYWSSSVVTPLSNATFLNFFSDWWDCTNTARDLGYSVRAVCPSSPSEYITFVDATVKAICLANWDKNDDGELSYEEAAAVKSIGKVFYKKQGISSFMELHYFTGLTEIEEQAFRECSLKTVAIPVGVKTIGEKAFMQCPNLSKVMLPEGLTKIDEEAFAECALTSITLPVSLIRIGEQALEENPLISITLPRNVAYLGNSDEDDLYGGVFDYCYSLKEVNVEEWNETYATFDGMLTTKDLTFLLFYPYAKGDSCEVPKGIEQIHYNAFNQCKITSVTLPSTLKSFYTDEFDYSAFSNNIDLRNVYAKMDVPFECGNYAFSDETYSLGTLYVPLGAKTLYETTVGWSRFQNIVEINYCPVAEAIDLGLPSGTKWASWNVDASKPEEKGGYYAWGETETKVVYNWKTYTHCDGSRNTCHHIGDDIAGTEYDVAHIKWGGSWRMPSSDQIFELIDKCSKTWTQQNGVSGILFTGPNGSTIFLPAGGYRTEESSNYEGIHGYYWTSSQNSSKLYYAYDIEFRTGGQCNRDNNNRYFGQLVRPVCP